jgi:hypothetical protein
VRLSIRLFGLDLLDVEVSTDSPSPEPEDDTARDLSGGTAYSTPIGFTPSPGDQRWERGTEHQ